ncbi:MAG: type II secretion system protein GspL [Tatlockia sp.]|jgi:general secretion pathway protein L
MDTCFLFAHHLNTEGALCLKLDQQGKVITPLAQRTFLEIKSLQLKAKTCVLVPGSKFSLHQVELPRLPDKKARAALPFALEEHIAQTIESTHFAYDTQFYRNGCYLVLAGDKSYLKNLMALLDEKHLDFDWLSLDWFALHSGEMALIEDFFLVNNAQFQGAISPDFASVYLNRIGKEERSFYTFTDSSPFLSNKIKPVEIQESAFVWLAKRLQANQVINLCQGELVHGSKHYLNKTLYQAALGMMGLWLLSILAVNLAQIHWLNRDLARVDSQIAVIYKQFFPHAHQIISPKFRIGQLLKGSQGAGEKSFWIILNKLSLSFTKGRVTLQHIRMQNNAVAVTLLAKNFETLEEFQATLLKNGLKTKQTQAFTRDNQVVSTLELSL